MLSQSTERARGILKMSESLYRIEKNTFYFL